MDTNVFERLLRRYFSEGLSGKDEFELELEASENAQARALLEKAERDDANIHLLLEEIADTPTQPRWWETKVAAMAASTVLAVGATLLATSTPVMVSDSSGLASSNVVYLETLRGSTGLEITTVSVREDDEWITLIAYPAYDNFTEFKVSVDRFDGDESQVNNPSTTSWMRVWQGRAYTGNEDAIAINVKGNVLAAGIHRLRIEGLDSSSNAYLPAANQLFRVAH